MAERPQDPPVPHGFWNDFRRFFFRGLAAVLPPLVTVMILVWIFTFVQDKLGTHVNTASKWVVVQAIGIAQKMPLSLRGHEAVWRAVEKIWRTYHLGWIGVMLAFVGIYIFGRFVASFVGHSAWRVIEHGLLRTPVVKQIYPSVKQVTDFLLSDRTVSFSRVVAVEYPRKGIWSLGFVTGPGFRGLREAVGTELLTVFIPSSPTPVTGYTITVRRDEVVDLGLTVDEALRFTVSGGVLVPPSQGGRTLGEVEETGSLLPPQSGEAEKQEQAAREVEENRRNNTRQQEKRQ